MTIIYCITHLESGRYYIGKTDFTLLDRWRGHVYSRNVNETHIARALRMYGPDAFTIEQVATAETSEQGNELEKLWILTTRSYDPEVGFNMTMGGDGGSYRQGKPHTQETKDKIREALLGQVRTEEQCRNISIGKKSRNHKDTPEARERKSLARIGEKNPNFGKTHSPETRAKMKIAWDARKLRGEQSKCPLSGQFLPKTTTQV